MSGETIGEIKQLVEREFSFLVSEYGLSGPMPNMGNVRFSLDYLGTRIGVEIEAEVAEKTAYVLLFQPIKGAVPNEIEDQAGHKQMIYLERALISLGLMTRDDVKRLREIPPGSDSFLITIMRLAALLRDYWEQILGRWTDLFRP